MGRSVTVVVLLALVVALAAAAAPASAPDARAANVASPCGTMDAIALGGVTQCTHGGDATPQVDEGASIQTRSIPQPPCPGNGRKGARIRVLLGVPSDTATPGGPSTRSLLRQSLSLADANLDAASKGPGQHYRFYCRHDTTVTITRVQLPPIGSDATYTFNDVTSGVIAAGYTASRTIYATFVANIDCCYTYGGQGSLASDDDPQASTNRNNRSWARYSMVRLGASYDAPTIALLFQHETGHNMGAVQNSAPHTSGAYHCFETNDVMCYNDGGPYFAGGGSLVSVCPSASSVGLYVFDCGGDDYYNVSPPHGSYLADHWNVAESRWLTPSGASGA
jgi:hypothetical protein